MTAPTPAVLARLDALAPGELPAYVYDLAALRTHAAAVRAALPAPVELYYAAKANPEPAVLAALAPYVDGYEVSSGGELAHVAAAVPGRRLAFGAPGKTPDELAAGRAAGVHRVHVESLHELRVLGAQTADAAPDAGTDVLLRVNLPVADGSLAGSALDMGGRPSPFGLDPADAGEAARLLAGGAYPRLRLRGVHAHLASGLDAPRLLGVARSVVAGALRLAGRAGLGAQGLEVNVGGGMAVDYADPEGRFDWRAYGSGLAELAVAHPGLTLRVEPGRALTAYCGWYATEVLDVKRSHGEEFAVVRGGTHHLRTPATKGHDQPCTVLPSPRPWPHPWPRPAARGAEVTVSGQLCTPKDVLARGVPAAGLRAGDLVVFSLAGAYAWNISHHGFLMHPHPGFHFLGGPG
ncbi:type III PLP-dependent enzyme [Streptomyces sp. NBC_01808]|uniref:type III PLP-dependent enzyme n=1 Tax=Streptomyces sp. NBC_01808 TaxID=2975947 RepID=UPI002DDB4B4C|nr:type III PLP-dependent enzyme [Streptomyces sp. NBC_01808]WSA42130.1 type III PLP-dependent enzyme [Streptomyces sp. NBC_01808]